MGGKVLVLGASGRFGGHAAAAFAAAGWEVTAFRRGGDLARAAEGMDAIVQGWNPPYPAWAAEVPGQTRAVIAAAEASGARAIVPGNVYVYGAGAPELLRVETPHAAATPLGRVRVEMEAAWRASRARVTILRAGDYLEAGASGGWFDRVIAAKVAQGRMSYPGALDRVHAWAWLPDMARAAVLLAAAGDALGRVVEMPFPGYAVTGAELHAAMERALGRPLRLRRMRWAPVRALGLVSPMMRCLAEMRYLWDMPHRLDPAPFAAFADFEGTPLEHALRVALHVDPDEAVA